MEGQKEKLKIQRPVQNKEATQGKSIQEEQVFDQNNFSHLENINDILSLQSQFLSSEDNDQTEYVNDLVSTNQPVEVNELTQGGRPQKIPTDPEKIADQFYKSYSFFLGTQTVLVKRLLESIAPYNSQKYKEVNSFYEKNILLKERIEI